MMTDYKQAYENEVELHRQTSTALLDMEFQLKVRTALIVFVAGVSLFFLALFLTATHKLETKNDSAASEKKALETSIAICEQRTHDAKVQRDTCEDRYNASFNIWLRQGR